MSRKELAKALVGRIKGLGQKGSITKAIDLGKLQVLEECLPVAKAKTRYARFRHCDPATHVTMLRDAVTFLKFSEIHSFFSGPIWTAETGEIRT